MHSLFFRTSPRGASLATVMMVVAMMLTLGFTVVAIAFNHLNLAFKTSNQTQANHLAEAVLAKAIDQIVKDQEFGLFGTASEKTVRITRPSSPNEMFHALPEGSEGVLTFDQDYAVSLGIPYSTNNRSDGALHVAPNTLVPGESFHLVATARVKNCISKMETIITVPKFPYSVAADGSIISEGGLVVASVKPGVVYDLNYPIHEDDLRPGHLVSNSKIGNEAVVLNGENKIYGDLQSSSGVTLEGDTSVFGEIRTNATDESLPRLNVTDYDPEFKPGVKPVYSDTGTLSIEGYNKSDHDLTVDQGIELDGGVLYVEGDLEVHAGGISGKGAIIATGSIRINGGGEAHTDSQAAIIAGGDIRLHGTATEKAKFAGLIYTEGKLDAENMRLAGVFVAAGDDSAVRFKDTEVYEDQELSQIDIGGFKMPTLTPGPTSFNGNPIPMSYDLADLEANLENYRNPIEGPEQPEYLFKAQSGSSYYTYHLNGSGGVQPALTTGPDQYVVNGATLGLRIFDTPVSSVSEAQAALIEGVSELEGRTLTNEEITELNGIATSRFTSGSAALKLAQVSALYTIGMADPGGGDGSNFTWSLDFSEFFSDGKPTQVLYWGVYSE